MRIEYHAVHLRRYLLGTATADEREAIERDYFAREDVLDQVSAAEEELIDEYLSARLPQADREQFERYYLASPNHRTRVAVVRAMRTAASTPPIRRFEKWIAPVTMSSRSARRTASWWAVAASLLILVAAGVWLTRPWSRADMVTDRRPAAPEAQDTVPRTTTPAPSVAAPSSTAPLDPSRRTATPPSQPVVVAVSISPLLVRGADEQSTITIARGTDIVRLQLRGQAGERLTRGRSVIRTVAGREVWRGLVTPTSSSLQPELARVDVPALTLPPDDYIIDLFETGAAGRDVERHKYFLRVQNP